MIDQCSLSRDSFPLIQAVLTIIRCLVLFTTCSFPFLVVQAQSASATLSGTVLDPNGAVVLDANITVTEVATGVQRTATTNDQGSFTIPLLKPSTYLLQIEHKGFVTAEVHDIVLNVGDERALRIQMRVGDVKEAVNITGEAPLINESPAVGTVVDRHFVSNMPLNGRSLQALISVVPGVVLANGDSGQFSVNGQRTNTNMFSVDGVAANVGVDTFVSTALTGSTGAFTAIGTTTGMVSLDALEEFKIQTSTFSAEYGRTQGGQVQILTRSGTNRFHGSVFEYIRNEAMDANDWFLNRSNLPRSPLRQNDFGGVLGGPIVRDKTFFFFSYEGLRLLLPNTINIFVPGPQLRKDAPPALQPYLNAFPLPTGPEDPVTRMAPLVAGYSNPSATNATSLRLDQNLGSRFMLFGRFNHAPSSSAMRNGPSLRTTYIQTDTITVGGNWILSPRMVNDARFNFSRTTGRQKDVLSDWRGAVPLTDAQLNPGATAPVELSQLFFRVAGNGYFAGSLAANLQRQVNFVDDFFYTRGTHALKFGFDFRRLSPVIASRTYGLTLDITTVAQLLASTITTVSLAHNDEVPLYMNSYAAFAQDSWKVNNRLTLDPGLRWDVNPAPHGANGEAITTVQNWLDPTTQTCCVTSSMQLAPPGTPMFATRFGSVAPRFGFAYNIINGGNHPLVVRGGAGVYYDLGMANIALGSTYWPHSASGTIRNASFPLTANQLAIPVLSGTLPLSSQFFTAFTPDYRVPRTYQYSLTFEQGLGQNQAISLAYVGSVGRNLIRRMQTSFTTSWCTNCFLQPMDNVDSSNYNALQVKYVHRFSRGLDAIVDWSWSHAIDTNSSESVALIPEQKIDPQLDRASSDFDRRHIFNAVLTYDIPAFFQSGLLRSVVGGWGLDTLIKAQTGAPINITVSRDLGFGTVSVRPDLVPGVPLFIQDNTQAGGKRINPAAFTVSPELRQGTLQRNALRGLGLYQMDLALRRRFRLRESLGLELRAEAFNILNHPNFGSFSGSLGSYSAGKINVSNSFGRISSMLNRSLTGLNQLHQIGGPRSIQLSLRFIFGAER